jgi:transposase
MIPILQRHAVQVLLAAGLGPARVAQLTGVPERSARRIGREPAITSLSLAASIRAVGRPSRVAEHQAFVVATLADEPNIKTVEVLHRLRCRGYTGAKSAVYELVASLRTKQAALLVRFEAVAGEFSQHDFGEVWVTFANGQRRKVRFFASRLKYSRWIQVTIVPDQQVETLVRTLVTHFEAMGGVPLLAVFDRPKTIAIAWDKSGRVTQWNQTFAQAMFELGVGVELCWPGRGQEKGAVENLVGWVKGSFFKQRRFVDEADLLSQLAEWLHEANYVRPSRATSEVPAARMVAERARLRPLKETSATLALRYSGHVGPTGDVLFEGVPYSMPPEAIGLPATLYVYRITVRIVAGRYSAEHPRGFEPGVRSILPEHRAEHVAAVSGQRGQRYLKRQHLLDLGPEALAFLTELVHRRPNTWYRDVDTLHDLLQAHGESALRAAFQTACQQEVFGAEYLQVLLTAPDQVANERLPV